KKVLPKRGEYDKRQHTGIQRSSARAVSEGIEKGEGQDLDEFTEVVGCHRKAAIRLLGRSSQPSGNKKHGRPRRYGAPAAEALRVTWEATDRLCSKRLHPFLPELVKVLRRYGERTMTAEIEAQLCVMSPSTIDRLLRPWRRLGGRRPFTATKPGSLLRRAIPIRTFAEWKEDRPGFLEVDLVHHCGDSTEGLYLTTLCTVDVATGWSECIGVWGKGQSRVGAAVHRVRQRLPFSLLGLDSDNGSEFINQHLYTYCGREGITFTRSRSYKKNDSCHVEQKNWSVVRRLVGYDRYSSRAALEVLNRVYDVVRLYVNFFQPVMKLVAKSRNGSKVRKIYDKARTPYQRLVEAGILTEAKQHELAAIYHGLNPVLLLSQINENLGRLWTLAEHPAPQPKAKTRTNSVTLISDATMALR
ncbi:MAG: hypothetical protein V3S51_00865, partial [Dehalococcoidia bacterium]